MYQKLKNIMLIRNQNDQIKQCVKSTGSKLKKYNSSITNMKFLIENYEFFSSMNYDILMVAAHVLLNKQC